MNLLLVEPDEIDGSGRVVVRDRRAEHLLKVLRVTPGRTLRVGLIRGSAGGGEVVAAGDGSVELRVDRSELSTPAPRPAVDLIVALPRPQVLHRVLQFAAALGVGRIDLVKAWRVEKSFFSSPSLRDETVRRHLLLGAEQGQTTWVPEVEIHTRLVPFLEAFAGASPEPPAERGGLRWLAHPETTETMEEAFPGPSDVHVTLAVGPEGGWIDREVETFQEVGFRPIRLGPWILRVETALAAALAQLEMVRRIGTAGCC